MYIHKCIFVLSYLKTAIHYIDVIMGGIASQIISLTIVYSSVYSDADQRKHQSSASLVFVRRIHRSPVNSPRKWPVTRKMFPFDDVIMASLKIYVGDYINEFDQFFILCVRQGIVDPSQYKDVFLRYLVPMLKIWRSRESLSLPIKFYQNTTELQPGLETSKHSVFLSSHWSWVDGLLWAVTWRYFIIKTSLADLSPWCQTTNTNHVLTSVAITFENENEVVTFGSRRWYKCMLISAFFLKMAIKF